MSSSLRILVIDDDPVMRELLEALLGYAGHRVEVTDSGIAALSLIAAAPEPFDVVLTDLHMPILQGHDLARRLLETRGPSTLLVGMSGSAPTAEETHLLDEFLAKPFTPEQFEQAVNRARITQSPEAATTAEEPVLDEAIFNRMSSMLPAEQLRGLYNLTLDDVAARLDRMRAAYPDDPDTLHREAHAIKGGTGMVGARQLHTLAAAVEAGQPVDFEKFAEACEQLKRMLNKRMST